MATSETQAVQLPDITAPLALTTDQTEPVAAGHAYPPSPCSQAALAIGPPSGTVVSASADHDSAIY
jgi:hypothetical protein